MINEHLVIGIDGGGTRLRAALVTVDGELLGLGEAGSGNFHDVGADQVRSNIRQAVAHAWTKSGQPSRPVNAMFLGLGSVATEPDRATIRSIVDSLNIVMDGRVSVDHDLRVALMGGLVGCAGSVLVAGTGSACYGRDEEGRSWQAGGWGPFLDDPGSSHWLGWQAMIAAIRDHDGRGERTELRGRVLAALELADIRQILRRVELEGMKRSEIAALASLVTEAAAEGDGVAQAIIDRGVEELSTMIATVAAKLNFANSAKPFPVAVTGGLTNAGAVFMGPLKIALQRKLPQAVVQEPVLPPVLGAALLAMELLGVSASRGIIDRMAIGHSGSLLCIAS